MPKDGPSTRQRIREHVLATLEQRTNARAVICGLPSDFGADGYPALYLVGGRETPQRRESYGPSIIADLELVITGIVRGDAAPDQVEAELDALIKEVEDALLADPTRGGLAIDTRPGEIITNEGDGFSVCAMQARFVVRYEYTLGDR